MQLNKQIFQQDKTCANQNNPEIQEYFEHNDLKAQLQAKDTVICKLKETIHSLRENVNPDKVKKDIDEIETINIELEHSVAKLLSENEKLHKETEHLKKTYKELYDSIKPSRALANEQCDYLIVNLNSKSMENSDLKTQIQEKVFANAALKNELRKHKGKTVIDTDFEIAFRRHTCFVRNLKGVDLLTGSRGTNLYTLSIGDIMKSSSILNNNNASVKSNHGEVLTKDTSSLMAINNLCKSISTLGDKNYLKSDDIKNMFLSPKLASIYCHATDLLPLYEKGINQGLFKLREQRTFIVYDDLKIELSSFFPTLWLYTHGIPADDIKIVEVSIGEPHALTILKAYPTSTSALIDFLNAFWKNSKAKST
ncbi:hypothetical protein Tco_0046874 [Tanacetum coccineum]